MGLPTVNRDPSVPSESVKEGDLKFKGKLLPLGPTECGHLTF